MLNIVFRKSMALGIIIIFVGASVIPAKGISLVKNQIYIEKKTPLMDLNTRGNILYVGGEDPGNYTKIQDAIDDASSGDTVFVFNGTYYENLIIDFPHLNLIGEDKNTTIINGGGSSDVIFITGNSGHVSIKGFKIINGGDFWYDTGIYIFLVGNNVISDNLITKNKENGIYLFSSDSNTIINNIIIENQGEGINLDMGHNNTISFNQIENNKNGIYYFVSDLSNNKHRKNPILAMGNDILNNNITSNTLSGIYEVGQCQDLISNNIITKNKVGIDYIDCFELDIIENTISENDFGIRGKGFYNFKMEIKKNTISENNCGIHICNNTNGFHKIHHNKIINNPECGLFIENSSKNEIHHNNFKNTKWGLFIENSSFTMIHHNNFIKCNIKAMHLRSHFNLWYRNYWNRPRVIPKLIFGAKGKLLLIPWIQFDIWPKLLQNKI